MEELLDNLHFINKDLFKEKNELRKKIYEKIINLKDYNILDEKEHFLFQKFKQLFEDEKEFIKLIDKYYNLNKLTESIKFYRNEIKDSS